jgi:murein tripeptide amidase MpaA
VRILLFISVFFTSFLALCLIDRREQQSIEHPIVYYSAPKPKILPKISNPMPSFMSYSGIVEQIKKWHQEAPDYTQVGIYGKSAEGTNLWYIRITSPSNQKKAVVLLTGSTHGNESLSTMTMMAYIGRLLADYGRHPRPTNILDTRDIFFIPVVSPDV